MADALLSDTAQKALHYTAPVASSVYFLVAKITAACLLQHACKGEGLKWRRYLAIALVLVVGTTVVAEAISSISMSVKHPDIQIPQDYVVYLVLMFAAHMSLGLGLIENETPLWHPYLGAWVIALVFEGSLLVRQAISRTLDGEFASSAFSFQCLRGFCLLALSVAACFFLLKDRVKRIRLDDESEALLAESANGHAPELSSRKGSTSSSSASGDGSDDGDTDALAYDSDNSEPEQDKEIRKQQQERLEASGNWFKYASEFRIFIPMIWPSQNRVVKACIALIGLTIVAERFLNVLVPRQLGILIDQLTVDAGTGVVPWKAIGLWALYYALSSQAGISLIRGLAEIPVENWSSKEITTTAFKHVMCLSMDFHNSKNSGEIIRAIDQGTNINNLLILIVFETLPVFADLIIAIFYLYALFDVYMSLILGTVGVSYVWLGARITMWNIDRRRGLNNGNRNESKVQNEAISNWQTVSHFNQSVYESKRYTNAVEASCRARWRYYVGWHIGAGAQSFVMLAGRLIASMLAVYRVSQGRAPIGNFIALHTYWSSIGYPLATVSFSVRKISQMLTDAERLLQLLQTKASVTDATDAQQLQVTQGEVSFEDVSFAYDERKPVLSDISFTVKPGQTVALVGETGGGKSTILKLLYRYYDVTGGRVCIDGQDVRDVTQDSLRAQFGMVPQDPALFNISIMDNIRYARLDASDADVHAACRAAAIHDKIASFPDGYASLVGERGVKLSGGELQRVAIARAILRQPRIVLLDEATSMIDAETEELIQAAFARLTEQRTTFIVAHRLSTIQHADLILVIGNGGIIERGTHEELLRQNGKYVKLWSKQLSKETELVKGSTRAKLIELAEGQNESTSG